MKRELHCIDCNQKLTQEAARYRHDTQGYALCARCASAMNESPATPQAVTLYLELRSRKLPVRLEFHDGEKTVAIAIPGKLYIEVDGPRPHPVKQAIDGLAHSARNWLQQIPTFQIPLFVLEHPCGLYRVAENLCQLSRRLEVQ